MAGIYNIEDKTIPFALPYGEHAIHSGNGKLIRHRTDIVGSELQVTAQLALAMGVLHSVERLTYDGHEIPGTNYHFFKGEPGETAADTFFPTDVNHPGASFINFSLPAGMKVDNQPDKAVLRAKCRETFDYNSSGVEIDFDYSPNPARAFADGTKVITGSTDLIEFGAYTNARDVYATQIPIVKDGVTIYVDRFRLDAFFMPPFTLKQFLDRICQLTCSDWQWRGGKIRLMPPETRPSAFTFDLTKIAQDFKFQSLLAKNAFNGVRVSFRDLDDEFLSEAAPILVDRRANEFIPENFYEFNCGVAYHDQAERVANYLAKVHCDSRDFALVRGSFHSYPALPADIVTLTHTTPDWTNKRCKVIKKVENEDTGIGYDIYARIEPVNPYSDDDFTPIVTRTPASLINPYAAPPVPEISITPELIATNAGVVTGSIFGTVNFGAFGFRQYAKVYWMPPGGDYEQIGGDLHPDANNQATFRLSDLPVGTHWFKAVGFNAVYLTSQSAAGTEVSIGQTSVNTETEAPVIAQVGASSPDSVQISVKNYTKLMRHRWIQVASDVGFTTLLQSYFIDFRAVVRVTDGVENIYRDFVPTDVFIRVSHSSNAVGYSPWSNVLPVTFENELELGVPVLHPSAPTVEKLVDQWLFRYKEPIQNNQSMETYISLHTPAHGTTITGAHAPDAVALNLNSLAGTTFKAGGGKAVINTNPQEMVSYTGTSSGGITGVTRGIDGTTPQTLLGGELIMPIDLESKIPNGEMFPLKQFADNYYAKFRWRNPYGYSLWTESVFAAGSAALVQPPDPEPPPPTPPAPPAGAEDPLVPKYSGRYKLIDLEVL